MDPRRSTCQHHHPDAFRERGTVEQQRNRRDCGHQTWRRKLLRCRGEGLHVPSLAQVVSCGFWQKLMQILVSAASVQDCSGPELTKLSLLLFLLPNTRGQSLRTYRRIRPGSHYLGLWFQMFLFGFILRCLDHLNTNFGDPCPGGSLTRSVCWNLVWISSNGSHQTS